MPKAAQISGSAYGDVAPVSPLVLVPFSLVTSAPSLTQLFSPELIVRVLLMLPLPAAPPQSRPAGRVQAMTPSCSPDAYRGKREKHRQRQKEAVRVRTQFYHRQECNSCSALCAVYGALSYGRHGRKLGAVCTRSTLRPCLTFGYYNRLLPLPLLPRIAIILVATPYSHHTCGGTILFLYSKDYSGVALPCVLRG